MIGHETASFYHECMYNSDQNSVQRYNVEQQYNTRRMQTILHTCVVRVRLGRATTNSCGRFRKSELQRARAYMCYPIDAGQACTTRNNNTQRVSTCNT